MVMQYIHINKIFFLIILITSLFCLASCKSEIPEGDIKDFVESLNFDKTYQETKCVNAVMTSEHYQDGTLQGKIETTTYINLEKGEYYYSKNDIYGNYYGIGEDKFNYHHQELVAYIDENNKVIAYKITDGKREELKYRPEDIVLLIKQFYYTDNQNNYHKGGIYYGDYIKTNCAKNYQFFKLNKEKTILYYQLNSLYTSKEKKKIIIMHSFSVNNLGMLLNLSTISFEQNNEKNKSITKIECDYKEKKELK